MSEAWKEHPTVAGRYAAFRAGIVVIRERSVWDVNMRAVARAPRLRPFKYPRKGK